MASRAGAIRDAAAEAPTSSADFGLRPFRFPMRPPFFSLPPSTKLRTRPDAQPTLATITVPALVLAGAENTIYPFETAQDMADAIPNATLAPPPGAAHAAIIEAGGGANVAIRDWAGGIGS